jgi:uncharacterized protein DUF4157/putative peptidoglycan binding protein
MASPAEYVFLLQRTIGNQRVRGLFESAAIQAKLTVGRPNDIHEQEADRVAEQVMQMREPAIRPQPACMEHGSSRRDQGEVVRIKDFGGHEPDVGTSIEASLRSLDGGGQSLPQSVRASFEPRFGCDFSRVRVPAEVEAAESARAIHARAFTLGREIVLGAGEFSPESTEGKKLLAHELAHVVQQRQIHPKPAMNYLTSADAHTIRRVDWSPNVRVRKDRRPFPDRWDIVGDDFKAQDTDSAVKIWREHHGSTYWRHGFTFGGRDAQGGPYSTYGEEVDKKVLPQDNWKPMGSCHAQPGDILVFYNYAHHVTHSGIITEVRLKLKSERFCADPILRLVIDNLLTLEKDRRGPQINQAVAKVQNALLDLGFELRRYKADGLFGGETENAVREYQTSRGCVVDGKIGPETLSSLDSEPTFIKSGLIDEEKSKLESKWGWGSHNTSSWRRNCGYGGYACYSHVPITLPGCGKGDHELQ